MDKTSSIMKIVILTEGPFPLGPASTIRILTYATGMKDAGANVIVLCTKPTEIKFREIRNTEIKGNFNGVPFMYIVKNTVRSTSIFKRFMHYYLGFVRAKNKLRQINHEKNIDVLFMGLSNPWFTWSYARWAKKNNILFVQERSEYPFIGVTSLRQKINLWLYLRFTCKLFDVIVVISKALEDYFSEWIHNDAEIYRLPMLVDLKRFGCNNKKPIWLPKKYIAYVGTMDEGKDGVITLIKSFARISLLHPDVDLVLIGEISCAEQYKLKKVIGRLYHRVRFVGRLEWDELPVFLESASYLALARPTSKQAEGGFPNKLGEYLATGKPVIITDVGEISNFLTDGKNAFISAPDSIVAFTDKLNEALTDPERAKIIGEEGRKLVETEFNPGLQASRMLNFLSTADKMIFVFKDSFYQRWFSNIQIKNKYSSRNFR